MLRYLCMLMALAFLAGPVWGQVQVSSSSQEPAVMPRVAVCDDEYFAVWVYEGEDELDTPHYEIWAARVSAGLSVQSRFQVYDGGSDQIVDLEVAAKADTMLVVFDIPSGIANVHTIYAAAVFPGDNVDWVEQVSPPGNSYSEPTVASCADSLIVAYSDVSNSTVRGRGVFPGADPPIPHDDFLIQTDACKPALAGDGGDFELVYVAVTNGYVKGREVGNSIQTPYTIYGSSSDGRPDVTPMPDSGTFLAAFRATISSEATLMVRMVTLSQALGDGPVTVCTGVDESHYATATSPINFGVVWQQQSDDDYIRAYRVNTGCALVGPREDIVEEEEDIEFLDPHATCYDEYYGIVWQETDEATYSYVWLDTLSCWQRHFYVRDVRGLGSNNGRHIALDPETGWLHRVYSQIADGDPPIDSVFYTYSTDDGDNWFPYEHLGPGRHPCVVCEDQGTNPVWVCFAVYEPEDDDTLKVLAREGPGDWESFDIPFVTGSEFAPPSMSMAYDEYTPKVYVACRMSFSGEDSIVFYPVRLSSGVDDAEAVWAAGVSDVPSLATTPEDIVHCVWGHGDDALGDGAEVYYRYRADDEWEPEDRQRVSDEGQDDCTNPCVDQDGDQVFAVYEYFSDVWYADRQVGEEYEWDNHENQSSTPPPGPRDAFPQNSTREATIWHQCAEGSGNKILLWLEDVIHVFRYANGNEVDRPHMTVVLNDPEEPQSVIRVYGTWVEYISELLYEVAFACSTYEPVSDGPHDYPFYEVLVGDTVPSRYCRSRGGYARWRGFTVDYARENLSYRLPYLNPHCVYKLMAVLYQTSNSTWEQSFTLDDRTICRARYRPETPETVLVTIPRDLYRRDFTVDLDIGRISGDHASVAELKLYEVYPFLERESRDVYLPVHEPVPRMLEVAGGNPFHSQARIHYSVPSSQQVSVRVYDVQGRVVSDLASGPHASGEYSVSWRGTDDLGRQVAAGAYFVELKSETSGTTRKLVYAP